MRDVSQAVRVLADLPVAPEQPLPEGFLEPQGGRDAAVDLRRGVLSVHVDLLRGHPVDVELGEVDGVVDLKRIRAWFSLGIFARKKVSFYASRVAVFMFVRCIEYFCIYVFGIVFCIKEFCFYVLNTF